jgi:5-(carboxyamino)imidazole ribonucleotide synthase
MDRPIPIARLGIVGGGQLGRMLVRAASRLGCESIVLDPYAQSPAGHVAARQIVGGFHDADKLRELVEASDVTTFDLENVGADTLAELADQGHTIHPAPTLLATIQDKLVQKEALAAAEIPQVEYADLEDNTPEAYAAFGYPLVQKARRGGYDGRGVAVLKSAERFSSHLPVPAYLERYVERRSELAVMVARGRDGETRAYPVVEMVFDERHNVLAMLLAPARIDEAVAARAQDMAVRAVSALGGVGVFGVEIFVTHDGDLLVNEISPRTHNSGHYTIEACVTDQFEQHLRAILGLPLGSVEQLRPAAMVNLLGEPGASGAAVVCGLEEALAMDGVSIHLYGKTETRPSRKMGHVTVLDDTLDAARAKAERVAGLLRVTTADGGEGERDG